MSQKCNCVVGTVRQYAVLLENTRVAGDAKSSKCELVTHAKNPLLKTRCKGG